MDKNFEEMKSRLFWDVNLSTLQIKDRIDTIERDNLLVPNVIGKSCQFENMSKFVMYLY